MSQETNRITVPEGDSGQRADRWVAGQWGLSRSAVQRLLEEGKALANGVPLAKNTKLKAGDVVELLQEEPQEECTAPQPQNIPLDIVYEDDCLLVVNKPKGMVVHPAAGNPDGTLVNALAWHCGGQLACCNGEDRAGIVHRIDKDTSGLLVVAKTDQAYESLAAQVKAHSMDRFYEAVVYGGLRDDQGTVNLPIGRSPRDRKKMAVVEGGREAVTHYTVLRRFPGQAGQSAFTHLRLQLETGRTHQIRVHMAHLGHPVAGDPVYGPKKCITSLGGQCLHARMLGFTHPVTGERLQFESPLPQYFTAFLAQLARRGGEEA